MIYYLCNFKGNEKGNIKFSPAGEAKMNYIAETLHKIEDTITILSTVEKTSPISFKFFKKKHFNDIKIYYFSSFSLGLKIFRKINNLWKKLQLYLFIKFKIKKDDTLIIYHDTVYIKLLTRILKKRNFNFILEIEEIYSIAWGKSKEYVDKEVSFFYLADSYILSTELLRKYVPESKKSIICHGTYKTLLQDDIQKNLFLDKKIHLVYAGTFNSIKGGIFTAIKLGEFLDSRYAIHILGFGSSIEIKEVKDEIEKINKRSQNIICYHGLVLGDEYNKLLLNCHIGLSTQKTLEKLNETSFPSKILSYFQNDLIVVSSRLKVLEISKLSKYLYFYEDDSIESLAKTIENININEANTGKNILHEMDIRFTNELKKNLYKVD